MKKTRGQSLFEVVIAIGVITAVLVALVGLIVTTQRNTGSARSNFDATKLAQELTEWLRGQRDTSWNTFYTNTATTTQCFNQLVWGNAGACAANETVGQTVYYREAVFTRVGADQVNIVVTVRWTDGQGNHSVDTGTILTDWRNN